METRTLGRTGLPVSALCFGTWEIGGLSWGPIAAEDAVTLLRQALDLGITTYDCSDAYGNGRSEVLLGAAFERHRHDVIYITKAGYIPGIDGAQTVLHWQYQNHSPDYLKIACEMSLRRLHTDYIDVYLLHDTPEHVLAQPEPFAALRELQQAGKIRSWGVSHSASGAATAIREQGVEVVEFPFSLLDQSPLDVLFPLAEQHGTGLLPRSPFGGGYLLDSVVAAARAGREPFKQHDRRRATSAEQLQDIVRKADALSFLVGDGAAPSLAAAAMQFVLSFEAVGSMVTGIMGSEELAANAAACSPSALTPELVQRARQLYAAGFASS